MEKTKAALTGYMTTVARLSYAQYWKVKQAPIIGELLLKVLNMAEMAKVSDLVKDRALINLKKLGSLY